MLKWGVPYWLGRELAMGVPRLRLWRSCIVLAALFVAGVADILHYWQESNRLHLIDGGSYLTSRLQYATPHCCFVGPIPLGPCPIAVWCGATVLAWATCRRGCLVGSLRAMLQRRFRVVSLMIAVALAAMTMWLATEGIRLGRRAILFRGRAITCQENENNCTKYMGLGTGGQ